MNGANTSGYTFEPEICFGPFHLVPARRLLFCGDRPVRLGEPSYNVLLALLEDPGVVIDQDTLIARAWGTIHVDETSLRTAVAGLRRAFRDAGSSRPYISTISRRGYSFVEAVTHARPSPALGSLPAQLAKVIGRDEFIAALVEDMAAHRLITVAGPGGIGKTTAALGAARRAISQHLVDSVAFVDIENVEDAAFLASAFRAGLGIAATTSNPIADILSFLDNRRILIVLDSCEGMIDPVARLVEEILGRAPNAIALVTSREPLRATGERIRRLDALSLPKATNGLTVELAMKYAAIELFADRASSSQPSFLLTDENVGIVADICCRLDGVPLSLEIAAARLDSFDLPVLVSVLDTHFRLQMLGRSTALARHRTLAAAIDWSYDTLAPDEQTALRRLSVFRGPFCFEAARSIVQCERIAAEHVGGLIARLAAKSMIVAGGGHSQGLNRLMETTRVYAFQKLELSGESDAVRQKHARHYSRSILLQGENKQFRSSTAWLGYCASMIHQIRSGLDWATSARGDFSVAFDLAIAAIPIWASLGLGDECMSQISHILAAPGAEPSVRQRLALAIAQQNMIKNTAARSEDLRRSWPEIADLAAKVTDPRLELQAIYGVMTNSRAIGNCTDALALADQFRSVALANKLEQFLPLADVLAGSILFSLAEFERGLQATEAGLMNPEAVVAQGYEMNDACDYLVLATGNLAMIQLVRGETDAALETCAANVARALSLESDPFICQATGASAVWVCLETNNLDLAEHYTALWLERSTKPALEIWHLMAEGMRGIIKSQRGEHGEAVGALTTTLNALRQTWGVSFRNIVLRYLANSLMATGNPERALTALNEAIDYACRSKEAWSLSLLIAMRAEARLRHDESATRIVVEEFQRALDLAESQGARLWTTRTNDIIRQCCAHFPEFAKAWTNDKGASLSVPLRGTDQRQNPREFVNSS
jgi:predicted ATPase/DNA-binding winged helix-turn-helix (wHTH) protein